MSGDLCRPLQSNQTNKTSRCQAAPKSPPKTRQTKRPTVMPLSCAVPLSCPHCHCRIIPRPAESDKRNVPLSGALQPNLTNKTSRCQAAQQPNLTNKTSRCQAPPRRPCHAPAAVRCRPLGTSPYSF